MKHVFTFFFVHFFMVSSSVVGLSEVPEELIPDLYLKYLEAVSSDKSRSSLRRSFKDNKEYRIHVQKLKEVNGYKRHNLYIKEVARDGSHSERFYINNPVESKMPNAFLTLEEFKEALLQRTNYKSTTNKVVITRNRKLYLKYMTFQPNILKTMRSSNTDNYVKLIKGLEVANSSTSTRKKTKKDVTLRTAQVIKHELREHNGTFATKTINLSRADTTFDTNITKDTLIPNVVSESVSLLKGTTSAVSNVNLETITLTEKDTASDAISINITKDKFVINNVTSLEGTTNDVTKVNQETITLSEKETTANALNENITKDTFVTNNVTGGITSLEGTTTHDSNINLDETTTLNDEKISEKQKRRLDSNKSGVSYEENAKETSITPSNINLESEDNITTLKIQERTDILPDYSDTVNDAETSEPSTYRATKLPKPSRPLVYQF